MRALRWSSEAESKAPMKSAQNRCQDFLGSALLRLSACRRSMLCKLREMNHATEKSITEIRIVVRASSKTKSIRQNPKGVRHSLLPLKRASSTARSGRERRVSAIRKTSQGGLQSLRTCLISICPRGSVGANKDRLPTLLKKLIGFARLVVFQTQKETVSGALGGVLGLILERGANNGGSLYEFGYATLA